MYSERWFTPLQGCNLVVDPVDFTTVEKASLDAIQDFAADPGNSDLELLHCLDSAGTQVIDTNIGYKSAQLTERMLRAMQDGDTRFWHNHPSGNSLSDADWTVAASTDRTEILAVTNSGTIFVGRMPEWNDGLSAVMGQNFHRIAGDLDVVLQNHTNSNELHGKRVASYYLDGHLLNVSLAYCGVVRYAASLSAVDAKALADADAGGLAAVGLSWATREIRRALRDHKG